jgi:hypothetical protein
LTRITLHSPFAPVDLATRLKDVLGTQRKAGVTGNGTEQDMLLYVYRPNFQNSFQTGLKAKMMPDGAGTRIEGKIGPPGSARGFMWVWFGFLGLFVIGGGAAMTAAGAPLGVNAMFFAIPLGMMAFGYGLWKLGTWNDDKDRAAILQFLADHVQARQV